MPANANLDKLFEKITFNLGIDPSKHLVFNELSDEQAKTLKKAQDILGDNINGDVKKFGGKVNVEEFKKVEEEINKRLENDMFKDEKKNLEKLLKKWLDLKKKELENYIFAIFPLKDMPFPSVSFMRLPRIVWSKGKIDKMSLNTNGIAYTGEVKALVTRTTLYGRPQKNSPLFAPHIGPLDLAGYKPDPQEKTPKNEIPRFILEVANALDRRTTQNQVTRYDDQYQRHGEPICDFLMKDEDLLKSLAKLTSAMDSKRQSSSAAIPAIILTLINTSLVMTLDEGKDAKKYENCFESVIKLAAASYETPNVKKGAAIEAQAAAMTQAAQANTPSGMGVGAMVPQAPPSRPQLAVWTEEELAEEAKKRGSAPVNLPVWTEEDLAEQAKKSGGINLPMWTEEELEKESARRHGAFNIPEWKEDDSMFECPKCGYMCRKGWPECPVCDAPLTNLPPKGAPKPNLASEPAPKSEEKKDVPPPAEKPAEK